MKTDNSTKLINNIIAGLTVSFVALSLGAAFGLLSGRGAFAGMISAALIALITSTFGGTRVQCSGPTGPMTTVTAVVVAFAHDKFMTQFPGIPTDHFINIVILLSGAILVLMAILRFGKFIKYVPNVVVSGFMSGIAIIIWLDQLKRLIGFGGKAAFEGDFSINVLITIITAILVFGLPVLLNKYFSKFASLISSTLLAIVIMTFVSNIFSLNIEHVQLTASLKSWHDVTTLFATQLPTEWSLGIILMALPFALQLSILAYLDTLMTSLVVDKMTKEKTKQNKELFAQGIGAAVVGLVGGLPGAQATIRSVLIIKEKANMRLAGILVGIFALIEMILFQDLINLIPQAVFTGILIKVGYDVFDWLPVRLYFKEWFKEEQKMIHNLLSRHDDEPIFVTHREFFIIVGTTLVTILFDLNIAAGLFTLIFYLHNKVFMRNNPIRDLKPIKETESFADEM